MSKVIGYSILQDSQLTGATSRISAVENRVTNIESKITVNINNSITEQIYAAIDKQVPAAIETQAAQIIYNNLQSTILDTESHLSQVITSKIADTVNEQNAIHGEMIATLNNTIDNFKADNLSEHNNLHTIINTVDTTLTARIATQENKEQGDVDTLNARIATQENKEQGDVDTLTARIEAQENKEQGDVDTLTARIEAQETKEQTDVDTLNARIEAQEIKEQTDVDELGNVDYRYESKIYAIEQFIRLMMSTYKIKDEAGQSYSYDGKVKGDFFPGPMFGIYGKIGTDKLVVGHDAYFSTSIFGKAANEWTGFVLISNNWQVLGNLHATKSQYFSTLTLNTPITDDMFPLKLRWSDSRGTPLHTIIIDSQALSSIPDFAGDIVQWGPDFVAADQSEFKTGLLVNDVAIPVTTVRGPVTDDIVGNGETKKRYTTLSQSYVVLDTTTKVIASVNNARYDLSVAPTDTFNPGDQRSYSQALDGYSLTPAWVYDLSSRNTTLYPDGSTVSVTSRTDDQGGNGMYLCVVMEKIDDLGAHLCYSVAFTKINSWSLIGDGVIDWATSVDLTATTQDPYVFSASNVPFKEGMFQIRANHTWAGGANENVMGTFLNLELSWGNFSASNQSFANMPLSFYSTPGNYQVNLSLKNIGKPSLRIAKSTV